MKSSLPLLLAFRYFHARRRGTGNASTLLSILGIAVGVMTLTVVLAVMNGFQLGFIESIVEISSYHLQARAPRSSPATAASGDLDPAVIERLRGLHGVTALVPFVQRQALIESAFQRPRVCSVRAVPPDLFRRDPVQARMLEPVEGSFDVGRPRGIVLGAELAAALGARVGDALSLSSYATGAGGKPVPRRDSFVLTGTFRTGYYDFDSGLVFISLDTADALYAGAAESASAGSETASGVTAESASPAARLPRTWGIKIANRFDDGPLLREASAVLQGTGFTVESWRSYNRSFFDALFVEKLMMMILVGLIFLVVGFNVFHSLRRSVHERMEEIAVLKSVGVPPRLIRATFILQGLFIGVAGGVAGLMAGLALSVNVNEVFAGVERLVNAAIMIARTVALSFAPEGSGGEFSIFSPSFFYLTRVPSHVFLREAFLVSFFAVVSCAGAAWAASRAVSLFRPSEVLRYE
ncbi:MAG: ABC transporter permease [Spirochaetia bacterium]